MRDFSIPGIVRRPGHWTIKKPELALPASAFPLRRRGRGALLRVGEMARVARSPKAAHCAQEPEASAFAPFL